LILNNFGTSNGCVLGIPTNYDVTEIPADIPNVKFPYSEYEVSL